MAKPFFKMFLKIKDMKVKYRQNRFLIESLELGLTGVGMQNILIVKKMLYLFLMK